MVSVEIDSDLDLASLQLESDVSVVLRAADAVEDLRVHVDAAPHDYAPRLTGTVQVTHWSVALRNGVRTNVVQVGVDYPLSDYSGYSGCAVSAAGGLAVGVLVEQVPNPGPPGTAAAPLLYALPIRTAVEALGLDVAVDTATADPVNPHAEAALAPPPPSPTFVARETELADLSRSWDEGAGTILLHGLPGGGKSALAAEATNHAARRFPDGILYLDLRGLEDPNNEADSALGQILDALGVPEASHPTAIDRRTALCRTLLEARSILVVLDDVRDEQQLRPLLVAGQSSSMLITSRSSLPAIPDLRRLEIEAMEPEDGLRLLLQLIGDKRVEDERTEALRLVELCGGLPLALRITGSRLATRSGWSIGEYADRLADERQRLKGLRLGDLDVRASFELSYRHLNDDEQRALRHVGLLRSSTVSAESMSAALGSDASSLLESLVDVGLLTIRQDRYEVHELIRLYARDLLDEEERRLGLRRLGTFYVDEMQQRGADLQVGGSPGALRWVTAERATLEQLPAELDAAGFSELTIDFAMNLGPLMDPLRAWKMWERALRIALDAATEQVEDPEEVFLKLTHNLGVASVRQGDEQEALRLFNEVLETARSRGNPSLEGRALAQLGQMAKQDRRPEDAVELLEASAAAYEKADEARGYAQALGDWANALDDLGNHEEALERHREAAWRFEKLGDRYSYGLERDNAGIALQRLGRFPEAAEAHLDAIRSYESIEAHIPAAVAKWRHASALWRQGQVPEGERLFAEAAEALESAEQHHALAELHGQREACLVGDQRYEEALEDALRAERLFAKAKDSRGEEFERQRIQALRQILKSGARFALELSREAAEILDQGDTAGAAELWRHAVDVLKANDLGWQAAIVLHMAGPLLEEANEQGPAEEFRQQTAELLEESGESFPWRDLSVSGARDRAQSAQLLLWLVQAVEASGLAGAREVSVSHHEWQPDTFRRFDAGRMYLHPDVVDERGERAHFLLGWYIHSMLAGQELMRRGVRADDELGAFLLDLAGEWLAASHFQDNTGTPRFRSAPPPEGLHDIRPLGRSIGAALAGSHPHLQEVNAWRKNHARSPFRQVADELMSTLEEVDSLQGLLDSLATYYKERGIP